MVHCTYEVGIDRATIVTLTGMQVLRANVGRVNDHP
jgi:hypothetical protein